MRGGGWGVLSPPPARSMFASVPPRRNQEDRDDHHHPDVPRASPNFGTGLIAHDPDFLPP